MKYILKYIYETRIETIPQYTMPICNKQLSYTDLVKQQIIDDVYGHTFLPKYKLKHGCPMDIVHIISQSDQTFEFPGLIGHKL